VTSDRLAEEKPVSGNNDPASRSEGQLTKQSKHPFSRQPRPGIRANSLVPYCVTSETESSSSEADLDTTKDEEEEEVVVRKTTANKICIAAMEESASLPAELTSTENSTLNRRLPDISGEVLTRSAETEICRRQEFHEESQETAISLSDPDSAGSLRLLGDACAELERESNQLVVTDGEQLTEELEQRQVFSCLNLTAVDGIIDRFAPSKEMSLVSQEANLRQEQLSDQSKSMRAPLVANAEQMSEPNCPELSVVPSKNKSDRKVIFAQEPQETDQHNRQVNLLVPASHALTLRSQNKAKFKPQGVKITFGKKQPSPSQNLVILPSEAAGLSSSQELENMPFSADSLSLVQKKVLFTDEEGRGLASLRLLSEKQAVEAVESVVTTVSASSSVPMAVENVHANPSKSVVKKPASVTCLEMATETRSRPENETPLCVSATKDPAPYIRVSVIQKMERPKSELESKQGVPPVSQQPLRPLSKFRIPKLTTKTPAATEHEVVGGIGQQDKLSKDVLSSAAGVQAPVAGTGQSLQAEIVVKSKPKESRSKPRSKTSKEHNKEQKERVRTQRESGFQSDTGPGELEKQEMEKLWGKEKGSRKRKELDKSQLVLPTSAGCPSVIHSVAIHSAQQLVSPASTPGKNQIPSVPSSLAHSVSPPPVPAQVLRSELLKRPDAANATASSILTSASRRMRKEKWLSVPPPSKKLPPALSQPAVPFQDLAPTDRLELESASSKNNEVSAEEDLLPNDLAPVPSALRQIVSQPVSSSGELSVLSAANCIGERAGSIREENQDFLARLDLLDRQVDQEMMEEDHRKELDDMEELDAIRHHLSSMSVAVTADGTPTSVSASGPSSASADGSTSMRAVDSSSTPASGPSCGPVNWSTLTTANGRNGISLPTDSGWSSTLPNRSSSMPAAGPSSSTSEPSSSRIPIVVVLGEKLKVLETPSSYLNTTLKV
jgi:hypothetical protein